MKEFIFISNLLDLDWLASEKFRVHCIDERSFERETKKMRKKEKKRGRRKRSSPLMAFP